MKFNSHIVAAASGSIGGATYSHNRYGQYIRKRIVPVNPASAAQVAVRNGFGNMASRWLTLTNAQRVGWTNYGIAVGSTDPLGASIHATGLNWYIAVNTLRIQAVLSVLDNAPTLPDRASLTPPVPTLSSGTTSHSFTNTDAWATAVGGALMIYQSFPKAQTINFYGGPYRLVQKVLGGVTPPTSPVVAVNPMTFVTPTRAFYRYVALNADGRFSPQTTAISNL